jgi:demethylmenaquinone methyltransferase/2-methoxy-6-polyprenyl-1,4-benzoquinol methylase
MSETSLVAPRPGSGQMFDAIAARYDLVNRIISLGIDQRWRRETVRALNLTAQAKVLDLATGTGDLALMTARLAPTAQLTGFDPSREMLRVFERKIAAASLGDRITIQQGEAEKLPYPDASFDGITMAFGIRNVADRPAALREMARVLKPGGRLCILETAEPKSGLLAMGARFHIHFVVPRLGALFSRAPEYAYLQRSIAAFPPPPEFATLMRSSGLNVLEVRPMTFGVVCLYVATVGGTVSP